MFSVSYYVDEYAKVLSRLDETTVERMARLLCDAWKDNRTVFCCGNGGSAVSASHFMMDLTKLSSPVNGPRIRALALTENVAAISAISNDLAYEEVFVEQMRPFLSQQDIVIGFSTSGSSANVIRAIQFANRMGAVTLGVTGRQGRKLKALARHTLIVDSTSVQQVEDATMVVAHMLCLRVKELIARQTTGMPAEEAVSLEELRAFGSRAV